MLALLSPAKKLDFESDITVPRRTTPALFDDTRELIEVARGLDTEDLKSLMKLSDKLAELNVERFSAMPDEPRGGTPRPAALAFAGDTYVGLDAGTLDKTSLSWAQKHVAILSGLYGVLRPLDVIQPYRLEMGTRLATERGRDLYAFWGDRVTDRINTMLRGHGDDTVVNLASNEYFKVVQPARLRGALVTPTFKEIREGKAKVISFLAKRARGMMARYIIDERIESAEALRGFDRAGYAFDEGLTEDEATPVFSRAS